MHTGHPPQQHGNLLVRPVEARCMECNAPLGEWRARSGYCCDYCLQTGATKANHH